MMVRASVRVVATAKWLVYCGTIALVGGGSVFVLTAQWLGLPVSRVLRETPLLGAVSPSLAAVGVLGVAAVLVADADLQS